MRISNFKSIVGLSSTTRLPFNKPDQKELIKVKLVGRFKEFKAG